MLVRTSELFSQDSFLSRSSIVNCGEQNFVAAKSSVATMADSVAAAVDCPVPSCPTSRGDILSSGTIWNVFVCFGEYGNKIIKHFDIFLTLFCSSVLNFSFPVLCLELMQS